MSPYFSSEKSKPLEGWKNYMRQTADIESHQYFSLENFKNMTKPMLREYLSLITRNYCVLCPWVTAFNTCQLSTAPMKDTYVLMHIRMHPRSAQSDLWVETDWWSKQTHLKRQTPLNECRLRWLLVNAREWGNWYYHYTLSPIYTHVLCVIS